MLEQNQRIFTAVYSLLLAVGGIGMVFLYFGTHVYPPLDSSALVSYSLSYSMPIAMLSIGLLYLSFGQRLFRPPHRWPIILGTALSLFIAVLAVTYQYNGRVDEASGEIQKLTIIDKRRLHSRGTTVHQVVVKSWRAGRKEERIRITELEFHSLTLPAEITFELMPGRLKHPWIASYSLNTL